MRKRTTMKCLAAAALCALATASVQAADPTEIRIGYAISKTGPYAGGAAITALPNYQIWQHDLEKSGGMLINGKRVPVRFIEYDDRSSSEESVRAVERLINQDKVDFILPPYSTGMNMAVAPILDRHGYPHLSTTMITDRLPQLRERWPNLFTFTPTSTEYAMGVIDLLTRLRSEGKIKGEVAMVNVADQFGVEISRAARDGLKKANFNIVYDQSYPLGSQDLQSIMNEVKRRDPEVFLAFSYPPDTVALTDQARAVGFNPKLFYTAIGTSFPVFKNRFGANTEGVLGVGGTDPELPGAKAYRARYLEVFKKETDYIDGTPIYASLQMLQQAIERANSVDRKAVSAEIAKGGFDTVVGPLTLKNRIWSEASFVGQWQNGWFQPVSPNAIGVKPAIFPKPAWKP